MTTFRNRSRRCFVCGNIKDFMEISSTNEFGSPDLDLRPAPMRRQTMNAWVHKCPVCGYAATNIDAPTEVTQDWLKSQAYRDCEGIAFESPLAATFYQAYMINKADGRRIAAFQALLHAAWSCDDLRDDANATRCRELALANLDAIIDDESDRRETLLLLKADLLRRAGRFDALLQEYAHVRFREDLHNKILAFQLKRAAAGDRACHTVREALEASPGEGDKRENGDADAPD